MQLLHPKQTKLAGTNQQSAVVKKKKSAKQVCLDQRKSEAMRSQLPGTTWFLEGILPTGRPLCSGIIKKKKVNVNHKHNR